VNTLIVAVAQYLLFGLALVAGLVWLALYDLARLANGSYEDET
jgi:hypothetical protein